MSVKISAIIITLNEENNISVCLDAVSQVADEIIIVDSFSTDRTKEICLAYGTKFYENKFEGYIEQKSFAATLGSNDWLLSLDADEVLSPKLIQSILKIKENPVYNAYSVNRLSFYVNKFIKHGHWFPDKKIRLLKKGSGYWTGINPHDRYVLNKGRAPLLKGVLYHYTFYSISDHLSQANIFSSIGAKQLFRENKLFLLLKALISPVWGFFYGYIFRLGFLDGWYGLIIAIISSTEAFLKYAKAIVLINNKKGPTYDVMHLSSMKTWRGGEQQVAYLMTELRTLGKEPYIVVAKNSELEIFCIENSFHFATLRYGNGYNIFAALKLKRITSRYQIGLIHMHCSPSHSLALFSYILGNKAKMILSRRVDFPINDNLFSLIKYNHPQIKNILCVSDKINKIITPVIKNQSKVKTVYSGIDLNKFSNTKGDILRKQYDLDKKSVLIGNIASIANHKDFFTFIDTAEILLNGGLNAKFLIIGDDGGEELQIRSYVKKKDLEKDIIFTGFRTDINNIFPELDLFLFTSKEEGLGTSVLDAMASRVPIVATRAGGIPEMITDGQNGFLCSIQHPQELADAVIKVVQDKELREFFVKNGSATVQKFSKQKTASETLAYYEEILI